MRLTRQALDKIIRDTVTQRTRSDRSILSVYLTGSLLGEEYLLGGAADVDLVFIHLDQPDQEREIVRLTDDLHLDIAHHLHRDYRQTRKLRVHPWLGPTIVRCRILYDPQHFMDFTQASVRGQYDQPEFVLERSRSLLDTARQVWLSYQLKTGEKGSAAVLDYLKAVAHAANAIASLNGAPLTDRRFLLDYLVRSEAVGRPGFYAGMLGLLGAPNVEVDQVKAWLPDWQSAYQALPGENTPARLHPVRRIYYQQGIDALLNSGQPMMAMWPLVWTWTRIVVLLPGEAEPRAAWETAMEELGLGGDGFKQHLAGLDAYLDSVEETLDRYARESGVT